ncbi:winged helix-turn-helix transcriptional regulator [Cucumibacter marinus]|uniref:winged helix-turn-helix transcriptional regulator n=1 Tax=Cucumibacter marinus TaxID=1121252 RepID=UPI000413C855|nr:winged helix-turn-helix transcriptional regulator [Cucumibacter marinus]
MDINSLVNVTSRAWAVPILWSLHAGVAGRQAPLVAATGAGRTAFAQSMDHLIDAGLMERNPGYGHPLRPEFRLTAKGKAFAPLAHRIREAVSDDDLELLRKSWTLPVLAVLHTPHQFNDLARALSPITDRALSQSLKAMEERGWVTRTIDDTARPPRSIYAATGTGKRLSDIIATEVEFPED